MSWEEEDRKREIGEKENKRVEQRERKEDRSEIINESNLIKKDN